MSYIDPLAGFDKDEPERTVELYLPLSDLVFEGVLETNGTNGPGDRVYVEGTIGGLKIDTTIDRSMLYDWDSDSDNYDHIPDRVRVRLHLSL